MDCVDKITITNFEGVYEPAEDSWLMVNHLPEIKESVLEIGCGAGIISVHLASKGAQVTAVATYSNVHPLPLLYPWYLRIEG